MAVSPGDEPGRTKNVGAPWGRGNLTALDRLTMGYLAATGAFALALGGGRGALLALVHLAAVLGIPELRRWRPRGTAGIFLRTAYPVIATPLLYAELAVLNRFLSPRFFDGLVQTWEAALFAGQPSLYLSDWWPWVPVSEALHLGYMAYYALVPLALYAAYRAGGAAGLHRTAFSVMAAFMVCYVIFIVFPVAGPRYEFARIGGPIADGSIHQLVHGILESGSSRGTAFPSSHVAASLAAVLGAGREDRRWLWALLVPEIALTVGTVYGRFHYAIDSVVGVAIAAGVVAATPALIRALRIRQPETTPGYQTE